MRRWLLSLLEIEVPLIFVVILRVVVGGEMVLQGYDKVQQGFVKQLRKEQEERPNPLLFYVDVWTEEKGILPWYKAFLDKAVKPNSDVFAALVTAAELAVGGMLILGLLVRPAAIIGILLVLNYLFATWHLEFPHPEMNALFLTSFVVLALCGAGRCLGFDALLHDRFPEIPLF